MYTSSIIFKYGDTDNVTKDAKVLLEILSRQGSELLINVIAEHAGTTANNFKLTDNKRSTLMISLVNTLKESLKERL